jgi:hypothetical protein
MPLLVSANDTRMQQFSEADHDDRATASAVAGGTVLPPARLILAQHGRNEKLVKREKNPGCR